MRKVITRSLIAGTAGSPFLVALIFMITTSPRARSAAPTTRGKCGRCHPEIAREWLNSLHAKAFQDTHFLEAIKGEKDAESKCFNCHAPEALRVKGVGKTPGFRVDARETGVDCVVCHTSLPGKLHAPFRSGAAPHEVEVDPQHKTEDLCASCHGAFGTVSEFKESGFFKSGHSCATCHMPKVQRASAVGGKVKAVSSHTWKGGDDLDLLKSAVKMEAAVDAEGVVKVKITNSGAGHKFPTGTQFHQAVLIVTVADGTGKVVFNILFADGTKIGGDDTRLKAGEIRTMTIGTGKKQGVFSARLLYRRAPSIPDADAKLVASFEKRQ